MNITDRYDEYLRSLLGGERASCRQIASELLEAGVPVRALYSDLFSTSLYRVGELWQSNKISVATEHRATAMTEDVMNRVVSPKIFAHDPSGRSLIVSCIPKEFHQMGGRMVADIAEMNGWDTHFLGANTQLPALLGLIDEKKPDALGLSMALYVNLPTLRQTIEGVRKLHPSLPIWLGGQAFRFGGQEIEREYPNVRGFESLEGLEAELREFSAGNARHP